VLGLKMKFESPGWSEFVTGETTLALHPASEKNPAGKVELGFTVPDVEAFYRDMSAKGVLFSMPPKKQDFGGVLNPVCRFRRRTLQRGRRRGLAAEVGSLLHQAVRRVFAYSDCKVLSTINHGRYCGDDAAHS